MGAQSSLVIERSGNVTPMISHAKGQGHSKQISCEKNDKIVGDQNSQGLGRDSEYETWGSILSFAEDSFVGNGYRSHAPKEPVYATPDHNYSDDAGYYSIGDQNLSSSKAGLIHSPETGSESNPTSTKRSL
jgi:hypothetical protein